ncbi:MAG: HAMP domain-containing protein, partial [Alphaproteobacteria bacterium]
MHKKLKLGAKVALLVSTVLVLILLVGTALFVRIQFQTFENDTLRSAHEALAILESLHSETMLNRADDATDDDPSIAILNGTMEKLDATSDRMKMWLVQGPKVLAYQKRQKGYQEPPQDDIDRQTIETALPARYISPEGILRHTRPVIMGQETAANPRCMECHGRLMSIQNGDVIGAYSVAFDASDALQKQKDLAFNAIFMAILVSLLIAAVTIFFLNKVAGKPLVIMTGLMRRLADGDLHVNIPEHKRTDEIGDMARALA